MGSVKRSGIREMVKIFTWVGVGDVTSCMGGGPKTENFSKSTRLSGHVTFVVEYCRIRNQLGFKVFCFN